MGTKTLQKSYISKQLASSYFFIFLPQHAEEIPQYLMLFKLKGGKGVLYQKRWGKVTLKSRKSVEHSGLNTGILKEVGNHWLRCKERCSLNQISCYYQFPEGCKCCKEHFF